ncbi:MAG: haloacid dehalogenase-like hydrolase [Gluconacetobacter sp.]
MGKTFWDAKPDLNTKVEQAGSNEVRPEKLPIVFDLDGTLLNGDSTSVWMLDRIKTSVWRTLAAVVAIPIAIPLTLYAQSRRIGGSIFLWIATVGLSEPELRRSFASFAANASMGKGVNWRAVGLAELEKHSREGVTVLIATAAPTWLAESLSDTLSVPIPVVGSSLIRFLGGWVANYHCRHQAKCEAIRRAGYGDRWAIAYSDSADDGPLLSGATTAFLVNASCRDTKRLTRSRVQFEQVAW